MRDLRRLVLVFLAALFGGAFGAGIAMGKAEHWLIGLCIGGGAAGLVAVAIVVLTLDIDGH